MVYQKQFSIAPLDKGCHLITNQVINNMPDIAGDGLLHVFIRHTSAGLTLNENADPSVRVDFNTYMDELVPENYPGFVHTFEGPDDMPAHLKSSLVGSSVSIPITRGKLNLGTWQGIYLCEFRNHGGPRTIMITVFS